eukprot:COSAG06_NODE_37342_length_436_cov_1.011869_2_plen_57_part_01
MTCTGSASRLLRTPRCGGQLTNEENGLGLLFIIPSDGPIVAASHYIGLLRLTGTKRR